MSAPGAGGGDGAPGAHDARGARDASSAPSAPSAPSARGGGPGFAPVRVLPAGPHALLVELADGEHAEAFHAELLRRRERGELPAVREIVPAARTVLLDGILDGIHDGTGERTPGARERFARDLASWRVEPPQREGREPVEIPVVYDGPDLDEVAALWGVPAGEVAALHSRTAFRVAFCGFAPGFGYLTGLPERLHVPRRTTPRTRVPAGAVALAGPYTGVYPRPSPGGWQIVGRMPDPGALWDPAREPAALLAPGTPVRFVAVGAGNGGAGALPAPRAGDFPAGRARAGDSPTGDSLLGDSPVGS
ncbi:MULTISPECIES: allophanate hydrolase subunit 1 [unclassified Streptomyces]|uniref:5-oxoprolinase subunit B family protein n=1 Tax=unclassified Streptomyces TaxID=2593676 RepID=UPI000AE9A78E|nr:MULTISPECIES: allophanate hydrolase subunit 1 [unclassified Streptomyces]WTC64135.1 allophanate hydrolase subunit 1 [Streptomyces anulatus]